MTNPNADRLTQLETLVMHLQHELAQQHAVLLELGQELRLLRTRQERNERRYETLETAIEQRSAADERPPHY